MMTASYEEMIIARLETEGLTNTSLKNELIDHFCCRIEDEMVSGKGFEDAYREAYEHISPNGLMEIEEETTLLLNYNKLMLMKRFTFGSGFIFSATLMIGIFMKILHFPGAMIVLGIGELGFCFIFLPLLLIGKFSKNPPAELSEKLKWILGAVSSIILAIGAFFKIGHLPGAGILLGISFIIMVLGFLPLLFLSMYRQSVERI